MTRSQWITWILLEIALVAGWVWAYEQMKGGLSSSAVILLILFCGWAGGGVAGWLTGKALRQIRR